MAKLLQLRRGTTSQHNSFTGAVGEVTVDTDKDTLVVHDGSTQGGTPLAKAADAVLPLDEDNFASDSATRPPSQQSAKAYITATSQPLDADLTSLASCQSGAAAALAALTSAEVEVLDGATVTTAELNILDGVTSTAAELNILDGVTSTAAELNILDGVTSTTAELNILDGVTSTAAEVNILSGVTSTSNELNLLDGATATTAEINILDGVTSTAAELNKLDGFTGDKDDLIYAKDLKATGVTAAEFDYLDGVTSAIQTQLDAKAALAGPALTGTTTAVNLTLSGDLTVNGTTSTINSTTLQVDDKNIELGTVASPTDSTADGGGITLKGDSDKTITWVNSSDSWDFNQDIKSSGQIYDTAGDVRKIPQNSQGNAYTLVLADAGHYILAGNTVTVPNNVFSTGHAVTIVNNTAGDITITKTITTMYNAADGTSANRTLATRGMATILFAAATIAYISGAGLS